jgi:acyl carrier protein
MDTRTVGSLNQCAGLLLSPANIFCWLVLTDESVLVPLSHFWGLLMETGERAKIFDFIVNLLNDREDMGPLTDDESLFVSGRLDSLSVVQLVEFIESEFGVDFAKVDFDISRIDSVDAIGELIQELRVASMS